MGKSQKEINALFKKLEGVSKELHLDVADGKFVHNTSLWFDFKLSKKFKYNAHLMIVHPERWIEKYGNKVDLCIVHLHAIKHIQFFIEYVRSKNKKVAIALNPETKIKELKDYLNDIDVILVMTVHPGFYGAKFLSSPLRKIKKIKKINPDIKVMVDGGMNPKTVRKAVRAGADSIISGSFISKSKNSKKAMKELKALVK